MAVELAAKYHMDGVEIRSVWEKNPHEMETKKIGLIKKIVDDYGLAVCGLSAPFFKCDLDDADNIRQHMDILQKSIDIAHEWDTNIIRGFTFWRKGNFEENLERIMQKFEAVVPILERENVILVLESDPSVFATNAQRLVQVIEGVDHPCVRALWDPGNDMYDPEGEQPFPTGYEKIKPYMRHMHLKDAKRYNGESVATPLGKGDVDYESHFIQLVEDDYQGYVVLETHYCAQNTLDETLLALPKGSEFSYLGYEATEESLINWNMILKKVVL